MPENSEQRIKVLDTVIAVADELGVNPGQVAIVWAGTHGSVAIIGHRSVIQLTDNLGALSVEVARPVRRTMPAPPWGQLAGVDLRTRTVKWKYDVGATRGT